MTRKSMVYWLGLTVLMCFGDALWVVGAQSQEHVGNVNVERNKALVRRWIDDGFNKRNVKVVDEIFVEDFVLGRQRVGRAALKGSMARFFTAFPDLHVTITDLLAEGDKVVLWYTVRGTHSGAFERLQPSGKLVNWSGSDLFRIERGKIIEGQFLDDMLQSLQIQGNEHD